MNEPLGRWDELERDRPSLRMIQRKIALARDHGEGSGTGTYVSMQHP